MIVLNRPSGIRTHYMLIHGSYGLTLFYNFFINSSFPVHMWHRSHWSFFYTTKPPTKQLVVLTIKKRPSEKMVIYRHRLTGHLTACVLWVNFPTLAPTQVPYFLTMTVSINITLLDFVGRFYSLFPVIP